MLPLFLLSYILTKVMFILCLFFNDRLKKCAHLVYTTTAKRNEAILRNTDKLQVRGFHISFSFRFIYGIPKLTC